MKVSIITISYNPGRQLKVAIDSVLSQQAVDIEYIIIDGGSTDGTAEYVASLNDQIGRFVSEPDNGLYDALNKGVRLATGEVIGFVHADDMLDRSTVLSEIAAVFEETGADAVYGDLLYVARDNPGRTIRHWKSGHYAPSRLKYGWMPPHPALYIKRGVYEKVRLSEGEYFDTSLTCSADYDFMMRLLRQANVSVSYLPSIVLKMRVGGVSNRSLKSMIRKSREDYVVMRRNKVGGIGTLLAKNIRKVSQFMHHGQKIERIALSSVRGSSRRAGELL